YIHKEEELDDVENRYPAERYVLIDDKLRILTAVKKAMGNRLTTVWPRQGHYADDPKATSQYPPPDIAIARIGDLAGFELSTLLDGSSSRNAGYPPRVKS